jgi:ABC-type nitrate/sulfonate/bicarbonate transport system permease component
VWSKVLGVVVVLGLWQLLAATLASGSVIWVTPWEIVKSVRADGWSFYWPNIQTTAWEAIKGFFWGNLLAITLAVTVLLIPLLERPLLQLSVVSYCLPIVAIGPIFAIIFTNELPKVVLAGMACFFTTVVGTIIGLRSADTTSLDMVRAFGGGRWKAIIKVRLRASLPSLFAALRIAAPAAILGAIIGEDLGGSRGLGVAMINSEQSLEIARTWGISLAATLLGGLGFGLFALLGRLLTPWARPTS